jgi:CHC2 zinc finger/Phage integrase family/DNA primase catalytic core, N-terminal domain
MSWQAADLLKQQISLLDYLQGQGWKPVRRSVSGRLLGLCPLHCDHQPSFLVDPNKNLFYCYGCGRGGDVIRLAELYHGVRFVEAMALLRHWSGLGSLLSDVAKFYQMHLHRHAEAVDYLLQRGLHQAVVIEELRIGYAPGRCLRAWMTSLGYPLESLQRAGLVNAEGYDTYSHRIVFPVEGNLYGRSTGAASPHLFVVGYHVGNRAGELKKLKWHQVDLKGREIRLNRKQTKGKKNRTLPIYGDMASWLEMQKTQRDEFWPDCELVFHYLGKPIGSHIKGWNRACESAGLAGLHFRDLRRSAVRNLERSGVPRKIAMSITGH